MAWLTVLRRDAPLVLSMPHTGLEIPTDYSRHLRSPWLARKDTDWWIDELYTFGASLGATIVRTAISRTVIDVNRDPSGRSLYPGQATTELCPTTTFDGESLYEDGFTPDAAGIVRRRATFFDPYHDAIAQELMRLRETHATVVLYDCHSIRSQIPRLFDGKLPDFNIGTYDGKSCSPQLTAKIEAAIGDATEFSRVTDGRFKGGYTIRHHGQPAGGVHAVQMELACSGGCPPVEPVLRRILEACLIFAQGAP
jgi:N-formylglutamate deformylase